uniref:Uncharacterized protein n=1 Tax=Pyricularia oryzae (strain P131) TaxID=1143193 RepID=L7J159_PYRO1
MSKEPGLSARELHGTDADCHVIFCNWASR